MGETTEMRRAIDEVRRAIDKLEAEVRVLHQSIATSTFPNGAWLTCEHPGCDRGEKITTEQAARYLAHGWPTHHGLTMRLSTARHPERTADAE